MMDEGGLAMAKPDDTQKASKSIGETNVFRDPIHGLIPVYPWELALIDTDEFQRLRRIHQLSMTYLIYHGAEHTRFGHSIGVMHTAGRVMDHLRNFEPMKNLSDEKFFEKKSLVRMTALLHDIGHGCYSHVGESETNIYPDLTDPASGETVSGHEVYTRCIIKERLAGVIERYWPPQDGYHMTEDILMLHSQGSSDPQFRFFDDIISGQMDCDKMDYLLRDSYYCGVEYGTYDLDKLIHSLRTANIADNYVLAVSQSGIQAVEEFVLARYWMFIQVYFHKDRRLFDYYLSSFLKEYLKHSVAKTGKYPDDLDRYLELDDAKIESEIKSYAKEKPAEDTKDICYFARRLYTRRHHSVVFDPPYVHYKVKDKEQAEAHSRIAYMGRKIKEYLKGFSSPEEARKVYVDLAKGSSAKHMFSIKVYDEEQDPDYDPKELTSKEIPAIPVVSKHDGSAGPIQDYSFPLRSISDRNIRILRVYAEDDIAEEVRAKCIEWFTTEYTTKAEALQKEEQRKAELQQQLEESASRVKELSDELDIPAEE